MAALRSLSAISRVLSRRCGVVGSPLERTLQIAKVPPAWRYFSEWSTNEDDPQNQENQQSADSGWVISSFDLQVTLCNLVYCRTQSQENPYFGISTSTFPENITKILMSPLDPSDIEMKPDGMKLLDMCHLGKEFCIGSGIIAVRLFICVFFLSVCLF